MISHLVPVGVGGHVCCTLNSVYSGYWASLGCRGALIPEESVSQNNTNNRLEIGATTREKTVGILRHDSGFVWGVMRSYTEKSDFRVRAAEEIGSTMVVISVPRWNYMQTLIISHILGYVIAQKILGRPVPSHSLEIFLYPEFQKSQGTAQNPTENEVGGGTKIFVFPAELWLKLTGKHER